MFKAIARAYTEHKKARQAATQLKDELKDYWGIDTRSKKTKGGFEILAIVTDHPDNMAGGLFGLPEIPETYKGYPVVPCFWKHGGYAF